MAFDAQAFVDEFLGGSRHVQITPDWRVVDVVSDRLRSGVDIVLEDGGGRRITVIAERNVEGTERLTATRHFAVSYYGVPEVSPQESAEVTRALAAWIAERETDTTSVLRVGAIQGRADRTLDVRINRECNERCVFCNTPENARFILESPGEVIALLERERYSGYAAVLFSGREPTLEPRLVEYVAHARDLGYERIRVQTNGTRLARNQLVDRLVQAGVVEFEISLHTLRPETFRELIGTPRLIEETLKGIEAVLQRGVRLHLVVVATRLNLAEIPGLFAELARRFPGHHPFVTLSPMAPVGDGSRRVDLIPRLAEMHAALPGIAASARHAGLQLEIPTRCGLPLCQTPAALRSMNREIDNTPGINLEQGKSKVPACRRCVYEDICAGVWSGYLEVWGDGEIVPISEAPDAPG
jgi:pyruvate-formate lyase-activating enzyme